MRPPGADKPAVAAGRVMCYSETGIFTGL